jgi:hypothetical protein
MRGRGYLILVAVTIFAGVGSSSAQERGHVAGVIGMTFGNETSPMYGGQFGIGLSNTIQVIGAVERMDDVLTGRYALLLSNISQVTGVDVQGEVPGTYYGGGARFTFPGLAASPFLQAELGATNTDATGLVFLDGGDDVTDQLPDELRQLLVTSTSFTFILSLGVRFDIGDNLLAEATFDFMDILTEREDIGLNRLNFAVGVRF